MNRTTETRFRKLEANAPAKRVRYVFSITSNEAEWDREIAAGLADPVDDFVRVGWIRRGLLSW